MGKKQKTKRKQHKKKNVQVKNDLSKGKNELPPKEVEGSSSDEDSSDTKDKVMLQKPAAALKKPAANASKNEESGINIDEPMTIASGSGTTHPGSSETSHASSSEATQPTTVIVPKANSIIVGNLSDNLKENQLWSFFQGVGEIVGIRLATFDDGTCKGSAQIEFTKPEAVHKAIMLNGKNLMGQAISINFGHERLTVSSGSSSSLRKPDYLLDNTILIRGFDAAYDKEEIGIHLVDHFGGCGDILKTVIMMDGEIGACNGSAFMEFADQKSMLNALQLNGFDLLGFRLLVEKARPSNSYRGRGGYGGGCGGRGRGPWGGDCCYISG